MEPSSAEDGDLRVGLRGKRHRLASMEPSSAEDGDTSIVGACGMGGRASMEPSSAEDGDRTSGSDSSDEEALQWSRPQQRTETWSASQPVGARHYASMEPSSAEDGDNPELTMGVAGASASMEPSSAEDGDCRSNCQAT